MTALSSRPRVHLAAAALLVLSALGAGACSGRTDGDNHAVAAVNARTTEAPTSTTEEPTTTTAPVVPTTAVKTATTVHHTVTTIAALNACTWDAHIVSGGIGSGSYVYDQFVVELTNAAWAGKNVGIRKVGMTKPATTMVPYNSAGDAPQNHGIRLADGSGHIQLVYSVNPYMQSGTITLTPQARDADEASMRRTDDAAWQTCDPHTFTVDYNGPEGLPGGTAASGASPYRPLPGQ